MTFKHGGKRRLGGSAQTNWAVEDRSKLSPIVISWLERWRGRQPTVTTTVKYVGEAAVNWSCISKAEVGQLCFCEGCIGQATFKVIFKKINKIKKQTIKKDICILVLKLCSPTQGISISSRTMLHAPQPGKSRSGRWQITTLRACHGQLKSPDVKLVENLWKTSKGR